jgi:outer membrane protein OmpA-like peptidoglycan-associated protein
MLLAAVVALRGIELHAQERFERDSVADQQVLFGLHGGFEYGLEIAHFPVFVSSADCGVFTSGRISSPFIGVEMIARSLLSKRCGIAVAIEYASASGRFTATPLEPLVIVDTTNFTSPSIQHEYRFNSSWTLLRVDILATLRLVDGVLLRVGPWIGDRTATSLAQSDAIVNEPVYRFEGGALEHPMNDGMRLTTRSLALGFAGGISAQVPLSSRLSVVPAITLRTELTSATSETSWRTFTAGGSVGLMYDLTQPAAPAQKPPPVQPPTNEPVAETRRMKRPVRMDLYGVDASGTRLPSATIRINEVLYRRRVPLPEGIYFDRGSAELPPRYVRYSREGTARFSLDSLADLDAAAIDDQSLNLLGYRMRQDNSARISLAGSALRGETPTLGRDRAVAVRQYLSDAWGIDSSRMAIAANPEGKRLRGEDGGGSVMIASNSPAITEPILLDHLVRDVEPPLIALEPSFDTAGLKRWTIALSYDGKEVGRYSSLDTGTAMSSIHWQIPDENSDLQHALLVGELTVEDSSGFEVSSRTQTPLTLERTFRIVERRSNDNRESIAYSLLAFPGNSTDIDGHNNNVLEEIAAHLHPGARVSVVGNGGGESSLDLSLRRADRVADALRSIVRSHGTRDVAVATQRSASDSGFGDQLPEGRAPWRDVEVVVEQSIMKGER